MEVQKMSANNAVVILGCSDQYRVKPINCIDNLYYSETDNSIYKDAVPSKLVNEFKYIKSTKNMNTAIMVAVQLYNQGHYEYGIKFIPVKKTWKELCEGENNNG
jgi:hypothetical protein